MGKGRRENLGDNRSFVVIVEGAREWNGHCHGVVTPAIILRFQMRRLRLMEIKEPRPGPHRW